MRNRYGQRKRAIDPDTIRAFVRTGVIVGSITVILSAYVTAALG
ncbi:MAG: hypothetical protein QNJ89_09580 [Acidimicrobiia bacterium]|nr:hypothetical protein [Acidimicrobiia bacterium]